MSWGNVQYICLKAQYAENVSIPQPPLKLSNNQNIARLIKVWTLILRKLVSQNWQHPFHDRYFAFTKSPLFVSQLICKRDFTVITYTQGCSAAGTRGNGVPTPFSRFALKWLWSCFKMAIFLMRSHTFFVSTTSLLSQDMLELEKLDALSNLVEISVIGNAVSRRLLHRPMLVYQQPNLQTIDGISVTPEERTKAELYFMDQQVSLF